MSGPDEFALRDVPGPSALGGGWRRALDLLYLIGLNSFKQTYFGTALGYLWSLARPLLLFSVLVEVFTKVFHIAKVPHYPVFLLLNIVLFGFFQEATTIAVGSVVAQEAVVRKTQFPRLVIPLAVVLTALLNLLVNLVIVAVFVVAFHVSPTWTWALFPILLLPLVVFTIAVSMILSSLYPRYRDIAIIWNVFVTALFYATPVLYGVSDLSGHHTLRRLIEINPLAPIFELARKWIIQPSAPGPVASAGGYLELLIPVAVGGLICVAAAWIFNREAPRIAEQL
ncbi:MAG: ABC transporter permease [Solirubrobacteraceae bacterium]